MLRPYASHGCYVMLKIDRTIGNNRNGKQKQSKLDANESWGETFD